MFTLNSTIVEATEFVLLCFPGDWSWWKGLLSATLLILFLVALSANFMLLLVIKIEPCLHQTMYYVLCILSMADLTGCFLVIPKILSNIWFELNTISAAACLMQSSLIYAFFAIQSGMFMVMSYDRYIAVCKPLQYHSICTNRFLLKAAVLAVGKNTIPLLPLAFLTARLHYCASNVIKHCYCDNLALISHACDNDPTIAIYVFVVMWFTSGFDLAFIIFSYCMIIRAVVQLRSKGALAKAFNTCASHLIVILYYYSFEIVAVITKTVENDISTDVHTLLDILFCVIPQVLNPLVYGLRSNVIKVRIIQIFRKCKRFQM